MAKRTGGNSSLWQGMISMFYAQQAANFNINFSYAQQAANFNINLTSVFS